MQYTKCILENQKRRGHELLPRELANKLPELYSTDGQGDQAMAQVKLFAVNGWDWYVTEFDGNDTLFGLVAGDYIELGYFSLSELEETRIPQASALAGYPAVERDLHFKPKSLAEVRRSVAAQRA